MFKIQYNNLVSNAQPGDSLIAIPERLVFENPKGGTVGGGGVNGGSIFAYSTLNNYPAIVTQNEVQELSGVIFVKIRKRTSGVVSNQIDTIKAYPNKLTIENIYW